METTQGGPLVQRVVWVGIVANLALALPTLLAPERMIALTGLPDGPP